MLLEPAKEEDHLENWTRLETFFLPSRKINQQKKDDTSSILSPFEANSYTPLWASDVS
jgi:hypothetical protein